MPLYLYHCEICEYEETEYRQLKDRHEPKYCQRKDDDSSDRCGGEMKLKISNTSVRMEKITDHPAGD